MTPELKPSRSKLSLDLIVSATFNKTWCRMSNYPEAWSQKIAPPWNMFCNILRMLPLEVYSRPGRDDWKWSTETRCPGMRSFCFKFISLSGSATVVEVFVGRLVAFPNWQAAHFGTAQFATPFGFLTTSLPLRMSHWRCWKPIWPSRKCQRNSSFWLSVRFWLVVAVTSIELDNAFAKAAFCPGNVPFMIGK